MRLRVFLFAVLFLSATFAYSFQEVKTLNLPADGIKKLEIDCGAGFLKVRGNEALNEIRVEAEIIVKGKSEKKAKDFIKKYIELFLDKRGNRAVLVSKIKPFHSLFSFRQRVINVTVDVPKNMPLDIDDGSGSISIENINGNIDVDDGSGSMSIEDVEGEIVIDDGSGGLSIEDITGNVEIEDGSGEIELQNVAGNVEIEDGSGKINAREIAGDVSIDDSSGSMYLFDIHGEVVVSDGSGSINIDGVDKDVIIKRDGTGSVKIKNVKGKVIK
ncbi:MAG: hypothetical protein ACETWK_10270 [Candidatus Aminicenantaceae bacterium]